MNLKKGGNQKKYIQPRILGAGRSVSVARGFTLVELLVGISIILILIGLISILGYRLKVWAKERSVMSAMSYLHNASFRYGQIIPETLSHKDASLYSVNTGSGLRPLTSMEYFIFRTSQIAECEQQLQRIEPSLYVPVVSANSIGGAQVYDIVLTANPTTVVKVKYPLKTVKDFNGVELKYCAYAAASDPVTSPPFDVSMAYAEYAYFASAGRDQEWGSLKDHDPALPDALAKDNIYSFTEHQ